MNSNHNTLDSMVVIRACFQESASTTMFSFPFLYLITYGNVSMNPRHLECLLLSVFCTLKCFRVSWSVCNVYHAFFGEKIVLPSLHGPYNCIQLFIIGRIIECLHPFYIEDYDGFPSLCQYGSNAYSISIKFHFEGLVEIR